MYNPLYIQQNNQGPFLSLLKNRNFRKRRNRRRNRRRRATRRVPNWSVESPEPRPKFQPTETDGGMTT